MLERHTSVTPAPLGFSPGRERATLQARTHTTRVSVPVDPGLEGDIPQSTTFGGGWAGPQPPHRKLKAESHYLGGRQPSTPRSPPVNSCRALCSPRSDPRRIRLRSPLGCSPEFFCGVYSGVVVILEAQTFLDPRYRYPGTGSGHTPVLQRPMNPELAGGPKANITGRWIRAALSTTRTTIPTTSSTAAGTTSYAGAGGGAACPRRAGPRATVAHVVRGVLG